MGLVIPLMFFILIYYVRKPDMKLYDFISELFRLRALPKLLSLCLLPDMILFFGFLRRDFLKSARGVIVSIFIYALVIFSLKLI